MSPLSQMSRPLVRSSSNMRSFSIAVPARREGQVINPKPRGYLADIYALVLVVVVPLFGVPWGPLPGPVAMTSWTVSEHTPPPPSAQQHPQLTVTFTCSKEPITRREATSERYFVRTQPTQPEQPETYQMVRQKMLEHRRHLDELDQYL
ncbi:hypothetical protein ASPNIDRAFT_44883 [Aspergillus niger ATCC 1015]|uniref:Uncharacterized protein n=1 Tax=Aspergillus niger (strain ATCC 1015 / CBS 113.46 / FGSC A1144 / LSHB Ac4 / NCTC 3858a / NRRL 328 / USDA 3528.7) TaxID=380704 RepID=G3XQ94_ASPNA|nr:hypothetical protein ASPNIDRAFT_44883 [Aspergillus niger ATCC 1015]